MHAAPRASTMQIPQTPSTICDSISTHYTTKRASLLHSHRVYQHRIETIDLTHEGRRKNSLQQWAGVTINTLMISRDRREKASGEAAGGTRPTLFKINPPQWQHGHTTSHQETAQSHSDTIIVGNVGIHSTGFWCFFVRERDEDSPSVKRPTRTAAGQELNWFCRARGVAGRSRTGAFVFGFMKIFRE